MQLVTFQKDSTARLGARVAKHIIDLVGVDPSIPGNMLDFLNAGDAARTAAEAIIRRAAKKKNLAIMIEAQQAFPEADVSLLPPLLFPGKMVCLGLNYRKHIEEMGHHPPDAPVLFAKLASSLIGHRQAIHYPTLSHMIDFEAELAIVIGHTARNVLPNDALQYVAGYTCFNDVSVRDYQQRTSQFMQGKNFYRSSPLGPTLVTSGEVGNPGILKIESRLNGEVMQSSSTSDLLFDVPTIISYVSQVMGLEPGDIIATGTPGGVGFARDPQVFLTPGDVIEVEVEKVGLLSNPVGEENGS